MKSDKHRYWTTPVMMAIAAIAFIAAIATSACGGSPASETTFVMRTVARPSLGGGYLNPDGTFTIIPRQEVPNSVLLQVEVENVGINVYSKRCVKHRASPLTLFSDGFANWYVVFEIDMVNKEELMALPGFQQYNANYTEGALFDCDSIGL